MWMIILPLLGGLLVAHFKPKQVSKLPIDGIILTSLILLLAVMGARIGVDPEVMGQLGNLGLSAFFLACFTIAGSVLALMLLDKIQMTGLRESKINKKQSSEFDKEMTEEQSTGENHLTLILATSVLVGVLAGWGALPEQILPVLEEVTAWILGLLLLGVGLDLGRSDKFLSSLKSQGFKIILFPIVAAAGSILGGLFIIIINTELLWNEAAALASGFGWYSLSAVIISEIHSPMLGALAFLTNVFRELLAIISIPTVAKYFGSIPSIGVGGATTMDVTLPIIAKGAGKEYVPAAFVHGVVLSLLVPILVNFFIAL